MLYRNGVGYFEQSGRVQSERVRLVLRASAVDDVLKTLTVIDESGRSARPTISAVLPSGSPSAAPGRAAHKERRVAIEVVLGNAKGRPMRLSYAIPAPAWRATYRLVLPTTPSGHAVLQGWAMIANATEHDWANVRLTLATGTPLSFALDLKTPRFVPRPHLLGGMAQPLSRVAIFAERYAQRTGDADGDGIADDVDACPEAPEDKDGFQDTDGCPDPDNDGDRVLDVDDKCPNEPETYNGYKDDDGCPDFARVEVRKGRIEILDKIYFQRDSARIRALSRPLLKAIAATLKGNPQIGRVEVQGHAALDERHGWRLAANRSAAVRSALVDLGVADRRLVVRVYGSTQPLDLQRTAQAYAKGRRVSFRILQRAGLDGQSSALHARSAVRPVAQAAGVASIAGSVRYRLPGLLSVKRGASALVSVIDHRVRGEEVYLYRPDDKVAASARYPFRAARLINGSKMTLEPGPIAVLSQGSFAGEGLIRRLHPGERALIPFALDGSTRVRKEVTHAEHPSQLLTLLDGVATVENHEERITRYIISSGSNAPGKMLIKHRRASGFEPIALPPGSEKRPASLLVAVPITSGARSVVDLRERRAVRRRIALFGRSGGEQLRVYLRGAANLLEGGRGARLKAVLALRADLDKVAEAIGELRQRLAQSANRAEELRRNIKAVARARGAASLRKQLLRALSQTTAATESHSAALVKAGISRSELRRRLNAALKTLNIDQRVSASPAL
ncbi:MAG: OmpA family protein [Deltaproteobacteria bacterium]|nr:OmpA family protein [Deltaproteobacteria bacterium]